MLRVFIFSIILLITRSDIAHAGVVCDDPGDQEVISKVRLLLYQGNGTRHTAISAPITNPEILMSFMSPDKDTVLYAHGWNEYAQMNFVQPIVEAYLAKGGVNLIVVDWANIAVNIDYIYSSKQVPGLGRKLGEAMNKLASVINFSTFHVIGHSLGAHVVAQVGKSLNTTLHRLTGLDPAYPLFYPSSCHFKPTDAEIVVALHTDTSGFIGVPFDTAQADFYANKDALTQPACPLMIVLFYCSHQISIEYYVESLTRPTAFPSYKCDEAHTGPPVYFGDAVPKSTIGQYCFNTNAIKPYGQGS